MSNSILNFDPLEYRARWERDGYLHVENGLNQEFFVRMRDKVMAEVNDGKSELEEWKFAAKKSQYLYEFDNELDRPSELYRAVSTITGLDLDELTLCERHVKAYTSTANPDPVPHKDRQASEIVVAMPISVSKETYLALFPTAPLDENPYQSTAKWRERACPDERVRTMLASYEPVKLYAKPGDVVFFQGARVFHERYNAANSVLLFLKFNALRMDPIGEDPSTAYLENRTSGLVSDLNDEALLGQRLEVSPRLEQVTADFDRRHWRPIYFASLWGGTEQELSDNQFELLRRIDRSKVTGQDILRDGYDQDAEELAGAIRQLCQKGFLVLSDCHPFEVAERQNG